MLLDSRKKNAFYAQSGGVTSVINASAAGLIETARKHGIRVLAGKNGILGALTEELIDTSKESLRDIHNLRYTPGGAFGSCRYKLPDLEHGLNEYEKLFNVFEAHDIGYFFYNGGGDSQDTTHKIFQASRSMGYPLVCIGIPKTVDNDLLFTDTCPGFGSAAKYIATSVREIDYDLMSMAASSTNIFVLEVMGRHSGWLAAAAGLAKEISEDAPHIILFPEVIFEDQKFLSEVKKSVDNYGRCLIVASEGVKNRDEFLLADIGCIDAFGHVQLGGIAPMLAKLIKTKLGYKHHWAVADYMQRSARHISSKNDLEQAYSLGKAAVFFAIEGKNDIMVTIVRKSDNPYRWEIGFVSLFEVANIERKLPSNFIDDSGFQITEACHRYLSPLVTGEAFLPFKNGLPKFTKLKNILVKKKLV